MAATFFLVKMDTATATANESGTVTIAGFRIGNQTFSGILKTSAWIVDEPQIAASVVIRPTATLASTPAVVSLFQNIANRSTGKFAAAAIPNASVVRKITFWPFIKIARSAAVIAARTAVTRAALICSRSVALP